MDGRNNKESVRNMGIKAKENESGSVRRKHLMILKGHYVEAILQGDKKLESRFTKTRRSPFGKISSGDELYLKISSGVVCGIAEVKKVEEWDNLTPQSMKKLRSKYGSLIGGDEEYWRAKEQSRYGVLIWMKNVRGIAKRTIQKTDRRAWVVLKTGNGYGLL